jgi:hypothetical protein
VPVNIWGEREHASIVDGDQEQSQNVSSIWIIVGSHKMHIFIANIPTFHSRYRRYVLITNEFYEFC